MLTQWRQRLSANTALRQLLPLLLPRDRIETDPSVAELLREPGWSELACQRGLGATFAVFLRQAGYWDSLPQLAQDRLDVAYRENLANWVLREQVLREILGAFRVFEKLPVVLKGLAFASELYPETAARQAGDIDLLIDPGWKEEMHTQLQRAGFRLISEAAPPPNRGKSFLRRASRLCAMSGNPSSTGAINDDDEGEAVYLIEAGGEDVLVEIHYHLINLRAGGGKEEVFRSRVEALPPTRVVELAAGEVRVLDRAAAFLHALRHVGLHHRLIGFRWHHDLALMLIRWETFLDPVQIRTRCRELNSEKLLNVELAILAELFGPRALPETGQKNWRGGTLPWEYPLYRHVAKGGQRTPWRELVRTLLAPSLREQLQTLT